MNQEMKTHVSAVVHMKYAQKNCLNFGNPSRRHLQPCTRDYSDNTPAKSRKKNIEKKKKRIAPQEAL